jgi:hypothetical protein
MYIYHRCNTFLGETWGEGENGLLDEGGEDGPEHLVGSLLGRLRFQVQVQKISAIQTIVNFFIFLCNTDDIR